MNFTVLTFSIRFLFEKEFGDMWFLTFSLVAFFVHFGRQAKYKFTRSKTMLCTHDKYELPLILSNINKRLTPVLEATPAIVWHFFFNNLRFILPYFSFAYFVYLWCLFLFFTYSQTSTAVKPNLTFALTSISPSPNAIFTFPFHVLAIGFSWRMA